MARVEITTAGHTISVDADGPLDQVAGKALYLWERTRDPNLVRAYPTGFAPVLERSDGPSYVSSHGVDLCHPDTQKGRDGQ
ncbi:hypothetical protein OOJ91_12240 [Micromonospora lupini]|uniref:hypothetical protein n=1 Tax=Micromonospora lupini TaxID=285679 RepID=UPI00225B6F56|nr:hypothetical protein [Micromonospora lupini]MCX5066648.1 hypothetical protein [Micromonospora lupini]